MEQEDIERVNERFNKRLDELESNPKQKDRILHLGHPGVFLRNGGIADGEIVLEFDKFVRKSSENYENNHPFKAEDIKNLPKAINAPVAVFDSTSNNDMVILTELKKDGKNFIVAIRAISHARKGGITLEINEITTLYTKNAKGIVKWFIDGLHTQIDKKKALRWIEALRPHVGTTISKEELDSAAKIVENYENPKLPNRKNNGGGENNLFREGETFAPEPMTAQRRHPHNIILPQPLPVRHTVGASWITTGLRIKVKDFL